MKLYRWWTPEIPLWNLSTSFSSCTAGVEEWFRKGIQLSCLRLKNINPHSFSCEKNAPFNPKRNQSKQLQVVMNSHNISCFQGADLLPMTTYKTWWIVGLWGQGDAMRKSTPEGDAGPTCSGMLVLKAGLRNPSAYPGTSVPAFCSPSLGWNPNRMYRMSDAASHLGLCNYYLSSCWGKPVEVLPLSVSFIPSVYHLYLSHIPHGVHLLRNWSPEAPRPVPTVSCCHLATSDHLEIYPTIKSFSRNPALQTWNARQSLSGWATQSQSWTVYRLPSQRHLSSSWQQWWVKRKLQNWQNQQ